jgi:hypothetical protein
MAFDRQGYVGVGAILLVFVGYVSLAGAMPVSILTWQWADDGLYFRLAQEFADGNWLGPYDELTLMKGPMFPIFIGVASYTGLPFNLVLPIFHFLATLVFCAVIYRISGSRLLTLVVMLALLLCPGLIIAWSRVLREWFYASLVLLYASTLIGVLYLCNSPRCYAVGGLMTGMVAAVVWLSREESVWIVPCSVVLVVVAIAQKHFAEEKGAGSQCKSSELGGYAYALVFLMVGFSTIWGAVAFLNYANYGRMVTVEMKDEHMQAALAALESAGAIFSVPYVSVPEQARDAISAKSPSFAAVLPYFPKEPNQATCKLLPSTCGDIASGWFIWEFRNAAAKAGMHKDAARAAEFYASVAEEVNAACNLGKLACRSRVLPFVPAMSDEQVRELPRQFWRGLRMTLYTNAPRSFEPPPSGEAPKLEKAILLLNRPLMTDEAGGVAASSGTQLMIKLWRQIQQGMISVFSAVVTVGYLAFVVIMFRARAVWRNPLFPVVLFSFVGAGTTLAMLAIVHVTLFPTLFHPRFPLIHLLVTMGGILSVYIVLRMVGGALSRVGGLVLTKK